MQTNQRPVVFIGHSLGGLLIKEVCLSTQVRNIVSTDDSLGFGARS